jgi:uncharacterized protein (TIGR02466 family)
MEKTNFFTTPIWIDKKPEFVKSLNKVSDKYIKEARKRNKKHIAKYGDFGISHHSTPLLYDNNFLDMRQYVGQKSWDFLDAIGYDMSQYQTMFSEMWVQEFAKKGGGHQTTHVHSNQHVSGFYFLKCSNKTSFPVFYDPRTGAKATALKMKTPEILSGTNVVHFIPKPGDLLIFPGYLEHGFAVDDGVEPFRFIHWNMQAVPKEMAKDVV